MQLISRTGFILLLLFSNGEFQSPPFSHPFIRRSMAIARNESGNGIQPIISNLN